MATIKKESFGKLSDGREVGLYTLRNTKGTEVKVTTYGARLVAWSAYGKDHKRTDIVLGYADGAAYEKDNTSMGGLVGRHANRTSRTTSTAASRASTRNSGRRRRRTRA